MKLYLGKKPILYHVTVQLTEVEIERLRWKLKQVLLDSTGDPAKFTSDGGPGLIIEKVNEEDK